MAQTTVSDERWTLVMPHELYTRLHSHLFSGDHEEHGAVIAAGIARSTCGTRLLARDLFLAADGMDYVAGRYGHRMLTAEFVRDQVLYCRDEELCYLAVHNHGLGIASRSLTLTSLPMSAAIRPYWTSIAANQSALSCSPARQLLATSG